MENTQRCFCLQPILGRADERRGCLSSWKMIWQQAKAPDSLTAGPRLRRGTTKISWKVRLPTSAVNTQTGSRSEAQTISRRNHWPPAHAHPLNSESLLTKDRDFHCYSHRKWFLIPLFYVSSTPIWEAFYSILNIQNTIPNISSKLLFHSP